jgi:hypothetical protein
VVGAVIGRSSMGIVAADCNEDVSLAMDISCCSVSLQISLQMLRQSSASWLVVEYGT